MVSQRLNRYYFEMVIHIGKIVGAESQFKSCCESFVQAVVLVVTAAAAAGTHAKAVRDEEKWPPLQPLKVSALVIILQPYFSRSLVRNKRPYIRLVSN